LGEDTRRDEQTLGGRRLILTSSRGQRKPVKRALGVGGFWKTDFGRRKGLVLEGKRLYTGKAKKPVRRGGIKEGTLVIGGNLDR